MKYLIGILFFCYSLPILAQYNICGHVHDLEHRPMRGANVCTNNLNYAATTDNTGYFCISSIPPGNYLITASMMGFKKQQKEIIVNGAVPHFDFHLETDTLSLDEMVFTSDIYDDLVKQKSLPITIFNERELHQNRSISLVKTLEQIPGFRSADIGSGFGKPIIRGLGFNRIVVVENGIKQQDQQWGQEHGLEIDQFNVKAVELIKGSSSLLYGSDAIGGVLNILPVHAPAPNTLEAETNFNTRSNNSLLGGSTMLALRKEKFFLMLRYTEQHFGDYKVTSDSFVYLTYSKPIYNRLLKNTAGYERNVTLITGIITKWGSSRITLSRVQQKTGMFPGAHGIPTLNTLVDDGSKYNIDLPYQQVSHLKLISNTHIYSGGKPIDIDFGFQQNHRAEFSYPHTHGLGLVPEGTLELNFLLNTYSLSAKKILVKREKASITGGINTEFQNNSRGGYAFLLPDFKQFSTGLFLTNDYQYSTSVRLITGLRYDYGTQHITGFKDPYTSMIVPTNQVIKYEYRAKDLNRQYSDWSGSVGLIKDWSNQIRTKLNVSRSYRMPGVIELSSNGVHHGSFRHERGNSSLTSEKAWQTDLGIDIKNKIIDFSINPYITYFSNFIFLNPSGSFSFLPDAGQIWQYTQSPALRWGVDWMMKIRIITRTEFNFGGEYIRATDLSNGYPIPFTPPGTIISGIRYMLPDSKKHQETFFNYQVRYLMLQNNVARNELTTPASLVHDVSAGTTVHLGKTELELMVMIQNIFNTKYFNHISYYRMLNIPEPGRNVQMILRIPFKTGI